MNEILTGKRYTIHQLICEIVENASERGLALPYPKLFSFRSIESQERNDIRLDQRQIDCIDQLLAELAPQPDVIDFKSYYSRSDGIRELIQLEFFRVSAEFNRAYPGA